MALQHTVPSRGARGWSPYRATDGGEQRWGKTEGTPSCKRAKPGNGYSSKALEPALDPAFPSGARMGEGQRTWECMATPKLRPAHPLLQSAAGAEQRM